MTGANRDFRATAISMWLQLITAAEITLIFALTALLPNMIQGWLFYLQPSEVAFEVAVRVIFTALIGAALATVATAAVAPFLFFFPASRQRISEKVREVFVGVGAFVDFAIVLRALSKWAGLPRAATLVLFACYCVAFAVILYLPRQRKKVVSGLDDFMGERPTRRTAIATGIASAALVAAELTLANATESAAVVRAASPKPPGPNILLITFDALSAEDMSLYGYRLPTTPHIDKFARKGSVFTNFYSASTFTTPSVASILSGVYPSEDRVYHLPGRFSGENAAETLPHLMRAGGYSTAASISSPYVYFFADGLADDYNVLPEMARARGGLLDVWNATQILHQRQPIGSRTREFMDLADAWDILPSTLEAHDPQLFGRTASEFPPALSFSQASEVLEKLDGKFFLWIHVMAPHGPYLPQKPWLGRFLPSEEMRTAAQQTGFPSVPHYAPELQSEVDKARLRYDEFIAETDSAFGSFMSWLESADKLRNTAVILSADHGESFEGGVYTHENEFQTRPEIHIPLVIRMPGQQGSRRLPNTFDQTALAPTILDIAGLPRPDRMRGPSLIPWLTSGQGSGGKDLAFTQYLETDSIFKPLNAGTVGVIDGRHQYILDLASGKGRLRSLDEAHIWDCDHSAENPALAEALRNTIYSRFPELPHRRV